MTESAQPSRFLSLMDVMLADMQRQESLHQPTSFWRDASARIAEEIHEHGLENFRSLKSTRDFFVPTYGTPGNLFSPQQISELEACLLKTAQPGSKPHLMLTEMLSGLAWALSDYRVYLAGDRPDQSPDLGLISESSTGNPSEVFEIEGRRFSRSLLNYMHGLVLLKQTVGFSEIRSILEVGGGYGTLGEILHASASGISYVDVDIPPTCAVASYYLNAIAGSKGTYYDKTQELSSIAVPAQREHMVLCPWQLPKLSGKIDLLWNFISFQEMEPDVVAFYIAEAKRLGCRYVLSRNLREGKQKRKPGSSAGVDTPITGADYDRLFSGFRVVRTNVFPFGYRTVDGFNSELRLYERI